MGSVSHLNTVKSLLLKKCVDILAVTETWLTKNDSENYANIDGYQFIRKDRYGKRGGGVGIYIRNGINYKIMLKSNELFDNKPEFIIIEIITPRGPLLCSVLYRRPRGEKLNNFLNEVLLLKPKYEHCIIIGDININIEVQSPAVTNLINELNDINMVLLPIKGTHVTATSCTTIDIIAVPDNMCTVFGKLFVPDLSAHYLIYVCYPLYRPQNVNTSFNYRNFNTVSSDAIDTAMSKINWNLLFCLVSINLKVETLTNKILQFWDENSPVKKGYSNKSKQPWIDKYVTGQIKMRDNAYRLWKSNRTQSNWENYIQLKKKTKQLIRYSTRKFMHSHIECKNVSTKTLWQNLKNYGLVPDNNKSQNLAVSKSDLLEVFSISQNIDDLVMKSIAVQYPAGVTTASTFYFRDVSAVEILAVINCISSNALGNDNVSIKMIKLLKIHLTDVLLHIINYSLQRSVFPESWKRAVVKPIPKITNPALASDYRPISILPVLSKILEKLVFDQIIQYVMKNSIMDGFQSGFRKLHSTGTALLRITEDVRLALGRKEVTVMVLFDFSKAFDSVIHEILLLKLRHINFSESVVNWISSYLSNRSFCVVDNNGKSEWKQLKCGVPQGSVLGPLLYNLYTFDIGSCFSKCSYHLYADDLQIYLSCKPNEISEAIAQINIEIENLVKWTIKHGLKLNNLKTQTIIIHKKGSINTCDVPKIRVNGVDIDFQNKVKNLGVIIDEHLTWNNHVSYICQRVYYALHRLYKFRTLTPINTRIRLVHCLILPIFDYCLFIFCNMSHSNIDRLQMAMNNSIRYIFDIKRREHITPYFAKLGWLKIRERMELQITVMAHKILQGYVPTYLSSLLTVMRNIHTRTTRSHDLYLQAPLAGKGATENSFTVVAYRLWNKLNPEYCLIKITALFKNKTECALLAKYIKAKY